MFLQIHVEPARAARGLLLAAELDRRDDRWATAGLRLDRDLAAIDLQRRIRHTLAAHAHVLHRREIDGDRVRFVGGADEHRTDRLAGRERAAIELDRDVGAVEMQRLLVGTDLRAVGLDVGVEDAARHGEHQRSETCSERSASHGVPRASTLTRQPSDPLSR
jgi:hypothetical protein